MAMRFHAIFLSPTEAGSSCPLPGLGSICEKSMFRPKTICLCRRACALHKTVEDFFVTDVCRHIARRR